MVWYEYSITFSLEVQQIWKRKISWFPALFYVNRYATLMCTVILILMQFQWPGLVDTVSLFIGVDRCPANLNLNIEVLSS